MGVVKLPELGEGIEKATVVSWYRKEGESVKEDDDIVELVTDKATFNVSAPTSGIVTKIFFQEGEEAVVGATLAVID